MQTIQEFILARVNDPVNDGKYPAEFRDAITEIIEWHSRWPVLTYSTPTMKSEIGATPDQLVLRMSQKVNWMIEKEYRRKFGEEPPTGPILKIIAAMWEWHEDYNDAWRER